MRSGRWLSDALLAVTYPQECGACGRGELTHQADFPACVACWETTPLHSPEPSELGCLKCGRQRRNATAAQLFKSGHPIPSDCQHCRDAAFDHARAVGEYAGGLRAAVLSLKRRAYVGRRVTELLLKTYQQSVFASTTLLLPIPLHPKRQKERGFNQAEVIATVLQRATRLPLRTACLERVTYTPPHRAITDARARHARVADAFAVRHPRLVAGEHILLIDDVMTSGATADRAAALLKGVGAAEVRILTLAQARLVR